MTNSTPTTERKRRRKPADADVARPETDAAQAVQEDMPLLRAGTAAPLHAQAAPAGHAPETPKAPAEPEAADAQEAPAVSEIPAEAPAASENTAEAVIPDAPADPAAEASAGPTEQAEQAEPAEPVAPRKPKRPAKAKKAAQAQAPEPAPAEAPVPAGTADGLPDPDDPEAIRAEAMRHGHRVAVIAAALFQDLASLHGLSDLWGHRLHHAAQLHDIGYAEGRKGHHKAAMRMIETGAAPWIEDADRPFVALLARYHRKAWPSKKQSRFAELGKKDREALRKAAALLRIADALDYTHQGAVGSVAVSVKKNKVLLVIECRGDCSEEIRRVREKGDLFRHLFGKNIVCTSVEA